MDDQNQRDIDTNGEGKSGAGFLKTKVLVAHYLNCCCWKQFQAEVRF